jgi:hypothetical protein
MFPSRIIEIWSGRYVRMNTNREFGGSKSWESLI